MRSSFVTTPGSSLVVTSLCSHLPFPTRLPRSYSKPAAISTCGLSGFVPTAEELMEPWDHQCMMDSLWTVCLADRIIRDLAM